MRCYFIVRGRWRQWIPDMERVPRRGKDYNNCCPSKNRKGSYFMILALTRFKWIALHWIGLDWIGLNWIEFSFQGFTQLPDHPWPPTNRGRAKQQSLAGLSDPFLHKCWLGVPILLIVNLLLCSHWWRAAIYSTPFMKCPNVFFCLDVAEYHRIWLVAWVAYNALNWMDLKCNCKARTYSKRWSLVVTRAKGALWPCRATMSKPIRSPLPLLISSV